MGSGASAWWKRKPKIPVYAKERRPPLTSGDEVLKHVEGRARLVEAMDENPPGTVFRWDKILKRLQHDLAPTHEQNDPIRVDIDMDELKRTLKQIYNGVENAGSDRIVLLRKYLPMMYDKHSVERARRVSQQERNDDCLTDEALAYGELNFEIFATMYEKITKAWGGAPEGKFFDLGCGVGQLVYTAAMINENKFESCGGIEVISNLLDRGVKRMLRWDTKVKVNFPNEVKDTRMLWANEDLFKSTVWHDATFLVIHWTAYSNKQVAALSDLLRVCKEGTHIITITHPIMSDGEDFELLVKDECVTSWGDADFFVYEKLTSSKAIA